MDRATKKQRVEATNQVSSEIQQELARRRTISIEHNNDNVEINEQESRTDKIDAGQQDSNLSYLQQTIVMDNQLTQRHISEHPVNMDAESVLDHLHKHYPLLSNNEKAICEDAHDKSHKLMQLIDCVSDQHDMECVENAFDVGNIQCQDLSQSNGNNFFPPSHKFAEQHHGEPTGMQKNSTCKTKCDSDMCPVIPEAPVGETSTVTDDDNVSPSFVIDGATSRSVSGKDNDNCQSSIDATSKPLTYKTISSWQCPICSKCFTDASELRIGTHTDVCLNINKSKVEICYGSRTKRARSKDIRTR
jgi:hypothetical protein